MNELWQKLLEFAEKEGISVTLHDNPSLSGFEGTSTPAEPWRINLYDCAARSKEQLCYTLAHEVGHVLDHKQQGYNFKYELAKMLLSDGEYLDARMRKAILDREVIATAYGRDLLMQLGLRDLEAYDKDAVENIGLYTKLFEQNNRHTEILNEVVS